MKNCWSAVYLLLTGSLSTLAFRLTNFCHTLYAIRMSPLSERSSLIVSLSPLSWTQEFEHWFTYSTRTHNSLSKTRLYCLLNQIQSQDNERLVRVVTGLTDNLPIGRKVKHFYQNCGSFWKKQSIELLVKTCVKRMADYLVRWTSVSVLQIKRLAKNLFFKSWNVSLIL